MKASARSQNFRTLKQDIPVARFFQSYFDSTLALSPSPQETTGFPEANGERSTREKLRKDFERERERETQALTQNITNDKQWQNAVVNRLIHRRNNTILDAKIVSKTSVVSRYVKLSQNAIQRVTCSDPQPIARRQTIRSTHLKANRRHDSSRSYAFNVRLKLTGFHIDTKK